MFYWDIELLNSINARDIIQAQDLMEITPENICHNVKYK